MFYKLHLSSKSPKSKIKKALNKRFFFLANKYNYQQFSPSPIGIHAVDLAASSAIF